MKSVPIVAPEIKLHGRMGVYHIDRWFDCFPRAVKGTNIATLHMGERGTCHGMFLLIKAPETGHLTRHVESGCASGRTIKPGMCIGTITPE